jgi:hypothetical protein
MLDRGYGAVGVAINSAPTEGVPVVPLSQIKSTFPVLRTVGRKKAAGVHPRAMALRIHQHLHRGGVQGAVRALPHPGLGAGAVGQCAGHLGARPPGHLRQLRQRRPGAAAVHLRRRGPSHAPQRPALQRQAIQIQRNARSEHVLVGNADPHDPIEYTRSEMTDPHWRRERATTLLLVLAGKTVSSQGY